MRPPSTVRSKATPDRECPPVPSFERHEDLLDATRRTPANDARSRRGVPRRPARGDRGAWSTTARGRSSCSAPAGARASSTSSRRGSCRDAGRGPTLHRRPLLALMRNQIAMAGRLGAPRRDDQLRATATSGTTIEAGARGRRDRRPADLARAARQRGFRDRDPARDRRARSACSSSTRRTASATGATTSGPTTGASARILAALPAGVPVLATTATANDRVVADVAEQLGEGVADRSRPAGRERRSRSGRVDARRPGRAAGVARRSISRTCPARGIVYCLTVADTQRVAAWLALAGHRRARLQRRRSTTERARGARGRAARQRDEGARRHVGARDGLRQARPRLRRPLPAAGLADRLLPAGRPRRAGASTRPAGILLRGREDDRIAEYFIQTAFPPTVNMEGILETLEAAGRPDVGGRAAVGGQPAEGTHRAGAEARSRSTARLPATAVGSRGPPNRGRRTRRASNA